MDSIWLKTSDKPRFDALGDNKKTDVLIIGGGIAFDHNNGKFG